MYLYTWTYYPVTFFDILGILSASRVLFSLSETPDALSHPQILAYWPLFHYDQLFENKTRIGREKAWSKLPVPPTGPHPQDSFRTCHSNRHSVDLHAHPSAGVGEQQQLFTRLWSPLEIFTRVLLAPKAKLRTMQRCWSLGGAPGSPWRSSLWG